MNTNKIMTLSKASRVVSRYKKQKKTVGLITGCFDVVHISHINYFLACKKMVDILVVGIDNDKSIQLSKGMGRPIFNQKIRSKVLSQLNCIDVIVPFNKDIVFGSGEAYQYLLKITKKISPNYLITNVLNDKYWKNVRRRSADANSKFIGLKISPVTEVYSSTSIIEKITEEI